MKSTSVPMICGISLAIMLFAGFSEWSNVRHYVAMTQAGFPISPSSGIPVGPANPGEIKQPVSEEGVQAAPRKTQLAGDVVDPSQKLFYEGLIQEMRTLQNQNRDLRDQMAETNRDIMSLGFRVDTHSTQFRPLPVTEELRSLKFGDEAGNGMGNNDGVLPPRAEPVFIPPEEFENQ
jgi:hypothetical protein